MVEGSATVIMAIMEFDILADAERFYNSPEYTAAQQSRIISITSTVCAAGRVATEQ